MATFGVCGGTSLALAASEAGFDYLEMSVAGLLKPRDTEAAFEAARDELLAACLPCKAVNGFVPGDLKIVGPGVDGVALRNYVETACARARAVGVEAIVFGSGGARHIPDGWARERAWDQLAAFCGMAGGAAAANGIVIAVEPLQVKECNVLTSVGEAARLVREVGHPAVRLLADSYHWGCDNDSFEDLVAGGDLLVHTHTATTGHRRPPAAEPCEKLAPFFEALRDAGYEGRVSIEARIENPAVELPAALALMKRLMGGQPR